MILHPRVTGVMRAETVLDRFMMNARSVPDRLAIWAEGSSFTYSELNDFALRVARKLQDNGIGRGDVVTIELPRCREYPAVMVGVWMLGGVFIPSDTSFSEERRDYIARDGGAKLRLTASFLDSPGDERIGSVCRDVDPSCTALIVYAPESTGKLRRIVTPHVAVCDAMERAAEAFDMTEGDRFAYISSFASMAGVMLNSWMLCGGTPLYAVPVDQCRTMAGVAGFIAEHSITHMLMAPSLAPGIRQRMKTLRAAFVAEDRAGGVFSDDFRLVNLRSISETCSGFDASVIEDETRKDARVDAARCYFSDLLSGYDRDSLPKGDVYHPDPEAPSTLSFTGARGVVSTAEGFCRDSKTGVSGLVCAAFGYVLSGFNGSDSSVFVTADGSGSTDLASLFLRAFPVVCDFKDDRRSPADVVMSISNQMASSVANGIYPFSDMCRELDVRADVMMVYQGDIFASEHGTGAEQRGPLLIRVMKTGDAFGYRADYDPARFTPDFIRSILRSIDNAIRLFTACGRLSEVVLADDESMRFLNKVNSTDVPYDTSLTVVDGFTGCARSNPDHVAVVHSGEAITYGELDRVSDYVARYVHEQGAGTDDFVGVLVHRGISMVTVTEGVLKSGAAYMPLDPSYPTERLEFMLKDSGAKLLIADRTLLTIVPNYTGRVLCLDEIPSLCAGVRPDVSPLRPSPGDAAVILYTSGTTGTPKGCVLEHGNLTAFLSWMIPEAGLAPDSVYASYASYGFDACMMDIHSCMTSGAVMHVIPDDIRKDLALIDDYYDENRVTHGFMTTQMGRMFMELTRAGSLRTFMLGGEALVPLSPPSGIDLINMYGPTECTVSVTTYRVRDDSALLPVGRPNPNVRVYVLDRYGRTVPTGSCGELCVSGPQVFRGYLNNPDKTSQVVVSNPYGDRPVHSRLYRTGDVVRLLPDGNIDYVGRRDGMVKIRGFRIELAEVEKVIRDHPLVIDATVTAVDNPAGGKSLVAYYVSKGVGADDLREFIGRTKPSYMIPSYFVPMDAIPVNVNGKVDRRRLPAPAVESERIGREPSGDVEKKLCDVFAKVLGVKKVFADDDFFAIGGTSISASKLVVGCMNAGLHVVFKNVFDNPTPEKLAAFIKSHSSTKLNVTVKSTMDKGPLSCNTVDELGDIGTSSLGTVLLTGSTGFLGAHVLRELLKFSSERIICLVRGREGRSSEDRLRGIFNHYSGDVVDERELSRVSVVDSDITDPELESRLRGMEFDTIINCAAIVKHYSFDDSLERVNVGGVKNLIGIAKKRGCRLVQISTRGVAGESVNGSVPEGMKLREDMLDFGQNLENKYIHSKFTAEREVINAISEGLDGKIIRVGNLMSRYEDGVFQINASTNAFLSELRSYYKIGCVSVADLDRPMEFSPIDKVAEAVVLLSGTPGKYTAFHVHSCHDVHMANVVKVMRDNGLEINVVSPAEFRKRFDEIIADDTRSQDVSGLISDFSNADESRRFIDADNTFTVRALYMLGFSWPIIDENYIDRVMKHLTSTGFFM